MQIRLLSRAYFAIMDVKTNALWTQVMESVGEYFGIMNSQETGSNHRYFLPGNALT